jgi:5'(3')-deoxyribonucleotidase
MRILLDCDGVLSSFTGAYLRVYRAVTGRAAKLADVKTYNIRSSLHATDVEQACIETALRDRGFCQNLRALPGARAGVAALRSAGHTLQIVTSPLPDAPHWEQERLNWLAAQFGFACGDVLFAHAKSSVEGDMLIDDATHHVDAWSARWEAGIAVLWGQHWNAGHSLAPRSVRTRCWDDVLRLASDGRTST